MTNSSSPGEARAQRDLLAWELALIAASAPEFMQHWDVLGVPRHELRVLVKHAIAFAQHIPEPPSMFAGAIERVRDEIRHAAGEDALARLDHWVKDDLVYFQDPAIHYVRAFESFIERSGPVDPAAFGVPDVVQDVMRPAFADISWRTAFSTIESRPPHARTDVSWETVEISLLSTVERRKFRAFWKTIAPHLSVVHQTRLRDWVLRVLDTDFRRLPLAVPAEDGTFSGRVT